MGCRPRYLDILKKAKDRAALCKIRISAHNLMIEKGRYQKLNRKDGNCLVCNAGEIENEEHFLLHCKHYKLIRSTFLKKIKSLIPNLLTNPYYAFC